MANCSYKISKVLANRPASLIDSIIHPSQSIFIKGKIILDSMVAAQEIIFQLKEGAGEATLLKLDFEKTFDNVN